MKVKILVTFLAVLVAVALFMNIFVQNNATIAGFMPRSSEDNNDNTAEMVLYYTSWNGYSKTFLPEWERFEHYAVQNFKNLRVKQILCDGGNEPICMQRGVEGYPTIMLYLDDGTEIKFDRERSFQSLIDFVTLHVPEP